MEEIQTAYSIFLSIISDDMTEHEQQKIYLLQGKNAVRRLTAVFLNGGRSIEHFQAISPLIVFTSVTHRSVISNI
ncbi:hypothetical protein AVEN_235241-1, partial [Araneus ventricosus]